MRTAIQITIATKTMEDRTIQMGIIMEIQLQMMGKEIIIQLIIPITQLGIILVEMETQLTVPQETEALQMAHQEMGALQMAHQETEALQMALLEMEVQLMVQQTLAMAQMETQLIQQLVKEED
jgi:hypothetical protein